MVLSDSHFFNSLSKSIFEDEKNTNQKIISVYSQLFNHNNDLSSHESIPIYDSYNDEITFLNHNIEIFSSLQVNANSDFNYIISIDMCGKENFANESQLCCTIIYKINANFNFLRFQLPQFEFVFLSNFIFKFMSTLNWNFEHSNSPHSPSALVSLYENQFHIFKHEHRLLILKFYLFMFGQFMYCFQISSSQILALESASLHYGQQCNTSRNILNIHSYFIGSCGKCLEVPVLEKFSEFVGF